MAHPPCTESCNACRRRQAPYEHYRNDRKANKEENGRARKKTQKTIEMKPAEENRGRRNTTFKPPGLWDFQNAAHTLKQIGDHLGHRSANSTLSYTKVDLVGLRQVAELDLGALR